MIKSLIKFFNKLKILVRNFFLHMGFAVSFIGYRGFIAYYSFLHSIFALKFYAYEDRLYVVVFRWYYIKQFVKYSGKSLKGFFSYFIGKLFWKLFLFAIIFIFFILAYNLFLRDYLDSFITYFDELGKDNEARKTLVKEIDKYRGYGFVGLTGFIIVVFLYIEGIKGGAKFENKFVPEEGDKATFIRIHSGRDGGKLRKLRRIWIKRRISEEGYHKIRKELEIKEQHTKIIREQIRRYSSGFGTVRYWEHYLTETEALLPPLPGEKNGYQYKTHVDYWKRQRQQKIDQTFKMLGFKDLEKGYDRFYIEEQKLETSFAINISKHGIISTVESSFDGWKIMDESTKEYKLHKREIRRALRYDRYVQIKARQKFLKDLLLAFLEHRYVVLQIEQAVLRKREKHLKLLLAELNIKKLLLEQELEQKVK